MEVINDLLNYKELKIYQNNKWFLFSLDAVLLANFVSINKKTKLIIDLGTGNAPIPLFLSKRTKATIVGIEIQEEITCLAQKSVKLNGLSEQINIRNLDIKNLRNFYNSDTFDVVICNPPYFKIGEKTIYNADIHKTIARHEVKVTLADIIKQASYLLKNGGNFALIHRTDRFIDIIKLLTENNLMPKKIRFVYPKKDQESNLVLIEATKNGRIGLKIMSPLYVHENDDSYTNEVKKIFEGDE